MLFFLGILFAASVLYFLWWIGVIVVATAIFELILLLLKAIFWIIIRPIVWLVIRPLQFLFGQRRAAVVYNPPQHAIATNMSTSAITPILLEAKPTTTVSEQTFQKLDQLAKLKTLLETNTISQMEFDALKNDVLGG